MAKTKNLNPEPDGNIVYSSRLMRVLNQTASVALWPLERILTTGADPEEAKVCFIVGAPRSGTTLLYELMVTRFHTAYFSNFSERLFKTPAVAARLGRNLMNKRAASYASDYGYLHGSAAPSESGRVWRHWMPDAAPYHLKRQGARPEVMRRTVAAIDRILGGPLVVKYLFFAAEIPRLARTFPHAVFIHIERDWEANAKSLLQLRKRSGKPGQWPSTRPHGWEEYASAEPILQSCAHVVLANREIEDGLATIAAARHMHVRYEDLCQTPRQVLAGIQAFMGRNDIEMHVREEIPDRFDSKSSSGADNEVESQIRAHIAAFRQMSGSPRESAHD